MRPPLRVIDTGVRGGRENIALDQALIESHRAGATPDTLRFLTFRPSALIGRHQDLSREIDLTYCGHNGIEVGRRVTGGGAIYLDDHQLGWELVLRRDALQGDLTAIAATICEAAAAGLAAAGIPAAYRPRNDIEVEGRKIGGTGGFFDGPTLFYQGTLILELDPRKMFGALRVPAEKRAKRAHDAATARVTSVAEVCGPGAPDRAAIVDAMARSFGERLGFEPVPGELSGDEAALAGDLLAEEIGTDDFVAEIDGLAADDGWSAATRTTPGGIVTAALRFAAGGRARIERACLSGDFFVTPPRVIPDLENALKDVAPEDAGAAARRFLESASVELMSLPPAELAAVVADAAAARV